MLNGYCQSRQEYGRAEREEKEGKNDIINNDNKNKKNNDSPGNKEDQANKTGDDQPLWEEANTENHYTCKHWEKIKVKCQDNEVHKY